jgi:hypothetical protein
MNVNMYDDNRAAVTMPYIFYAFFVQTEFVKFTDGGSCQSVQMFPKLHAVIGLDVGLLCC